MTLAILSAIAFGLCYVGLFIFFAWEDLCVLARRLAVGVGFGIYTVMILCMAAVILLEVFGCNPTHWTDVPSSVVDQQAISHNERVCAERGQVFNAVLWRCE